MKINELFTIGGMTQSIGGLATFLDRDNCQIENKTKKDHAVLLHMKRESDGEEGHAYLRVQEKFADISDQLLSWAFANQKLIGLTLNQLGDFETNLQINSMGGRMMLKS